MVLVLLVLLVLHCFTKYSAYHRDIYSTNVRTLHQYVPPSSKYFVCSDSLEVSSAIVLSAIHKFECLKTKCAICKVCRPSVRKNYFYNVSPQTSTLLLLLRSGDVSTNSGPPESKRKYTPKNPCSRCGKGVSARNRAVSCDCAGSGHTTDVQVCSAMKPMMSCATAEIILILYANDAHFTSSRSPMTRSTTTSVTFLRLPRHQTSMMMDVLRVALTSNPTNLTVFFKEKACILYILKPGAYCPNWTN